MRRRNVLALGLVSLSAALRPWPASAQARDRVKYPEHPIRLVVQRTAGGGVDVVARLWAERIKPQLGAIVIENQGGGGGTIAATAVARAAGDGYTLLAGTTSELVINPVIMSQPSYDPVKDLVPIAITAVSVSSLMVHESVPARTLAELIAYAKANPGKLNFANSGTGGAPHLAGVEFAARTGVQWAYIPYKGGSAAVTDVVAGNANVLFNGMLATYPSVKGGRLKGLAVSSAQRVPSAPELPTVAETLPGFETGSYQGLLAAAGTPREIVTKLNAELTRILNTNDMKEFLAKQGTEVRAGTPEALGTFIVNEKARWAKVVKEAGIKAD